MCAGEALMRGRLGLISNKDQEPIIYQLDKGQDATIHNGIIFARNQAMYDLIQERLKPYLSNLKMTEGTK